MKSPDHKLHIAAQGLGSPAGGGAGQVGLSKLIIAQHAVGRTQAVRPLHAMLGAFVLK